MGSDYPYDMGTGECVRQVDALWIEDAEKAAILNGNVVKLLGVSDHAVSSGATSS